MVYSVLKSRTPGVPLMTPLAWLKWNAEPGFGEISQLVAAPPELLGLECGVIATPKVAVISFNE